MERQIIIVTTEEELERVIRRILESYKPKPETILKDRIGVEDALKLLECSNPTLLKYIKEGKVKAYGTPRKRYFFRSEIIEVIRSMYPS
jgi:hypothetical protein